MADVMSPPNASAPDAQAAAAARKARRKKTRWGADVETPKDDTKVAQAGSTEIPSVTSAPGSVGTANTPPQQELTGLKLNSSVPSGTPVPGQPSHASASGQPAGFPTLVSSQGHTATATAAATTAAATPPPWLAGHYAPTPYGGADTSKDEALPGPPPQPTAQQPWLPQSAPAPHPSGPYASHPAAGPHPGYGAEYYYQSAGGYSAPYLHLPTLLKPSPAEDDRPPGVEDAEEGPAGADPPAADGSSQPPPSLSGSASTAPEAAGSQPQSEPQLPGPPAAHPHPATAPPSFPSAANPAADAAGAYPTASADPYAQPYPHPYPHPQYPPQYAVPEPAAEAEPGPPGDEEEPQAPGTEGDAPAAAEYGYPGGYTDPAYAYAQYGSYTDPQTGYTYPYDPQQAYGYDPAYYGYDATSFAQYEGQAAGATAAVAPGAPAGEPGPPAGSPKKEPKAEDGKPAKPAPPVVQVKLPKQYVEKQQAKKREEEERRKQELMRQAAEAEARRRAAAEEAAAAAARRAHLTDMTNGHAEEQEVQFKDLDPEDQLLAASTPAEIRAAKKAVAAKEAAQKKAAAAEAAAAMPKSIPQVKEKEKDPGQHERKRRTKSRWRDDEARDGEIDVKASKRRRASPGFQPRIKLGRPRSLSMSPPPMREPGMLRSPPRRRAPPREPSPERPKSRRPRGYRLRRSPSPEVSASPARYTPQPPQEHEPQPAPKPEPTEEEKAAAAAEAAASAREVTPEVSEEGEIAVDPEELEEISKAQQQAASKSANPHPQPHHHPAGKQANDRGRDRDRDRGADRDTGHPGQERYSGGGRGDRGSRRRGRGRGGYQPDIGRDGRLGFDRSARPHDNYVRPPPGLPAPQMFAQYPQPQYQEEYDGYDDEGVAYEEPNIYAPQAYDAPYGVYGSAVGAAAIGQGVYGQYGSYS